MINSASLFLGPGLESARICRSVVVCGAVKITRKTTAAERSTCRGLMEQSVEMASGVRKVNVWREIDQRSHHFTAAGDHGASEYYK